LKLSPTKVRALRERKMLTQQEVAEGIGTSVFTVARIERGGGGVRPQNGRRLAELLGVAPEELLEEVTAPGKAPAPPSLEPTFNDALKEEDEERRLIRYMRSWIVYLIREAERYEEAVDAGRVNLGMYQEATNSGGNLLRAITVLMEDLDAAGFRETKETTTEREFFSALNRWAWAIDSLEKAIEAQISNSELAQRREERHAALGEITKSAGEA
jgi:transcriptional regulator with XRE-family HTH domain